MVLNSIEKSKCTPNVRQQCLEYIVTMKLIFYIVFILLEEFFEYRFEKLKPQSIKYNITITYY